MFGNGNYDKNKTKNIGYKFDNFLYAMNGKPSEVNDLVEQGNYSQILSEDIKRAMIASERINKSTGIFNHNRDFGFLKAPSIDFEKLKKNDLEYMDKYTKIMKRRIERSEFLYDKTYRGGEYATLRREMSKVVENKNNGSFLNISINPYALANFIMLNGLGTTLAMPFKHLRDNFDDFVLTPIYMASDFADRIGLMKLDRDAVKRYNQFEEGAEYNPKNDYQQVEKFIQSERTNSFGYKSLAKDALNLENLISNEDRHHTEELINKMIEENQIFSFSNSAFDIYDRFRPRNVIRYMKEDEPDKIRELGNVADMMNEYNHLDDWDTIKVGDVEYSKNDYLQHIKETITDAFDFTKVGKVADYTQFENYGAYSARNTDYDCEAEKNSKQMVTEQMIRNEIAEEFQKRGYEVKDNELEISFDNNTFAIKNSSPVGSVNDFAMEISDEYLGDDGKVDLEVLHNALLNGTVEPFNEYLDKEYPEIDKDLAKSKRNKAFDFDFEEPFEFNLNPDDYAFVYDEKMRLKDTPEFGAITKFYEKALGNVLTNEQIESAIINTLNKNTGNDLSDVDISAMSDNFDKILKKSIVTTFYNMEEQSGVMLNDKQMRTLDGFISDIKDMASQRRAEIKKSEEYKDKYENDKTSRSTSYDGTYDGGKYNSREDADRNVDLYNSAEATRIYEQNQKDNHRNDDNDYDSNSDVDI